MSTANLTDHSNPDPVKPWSRIDQDWVVAQLQRNASTTTLRKASSSSDVPDDPFLRPDLDLGSRTKPIPKVTRFFSEQEFEGTVVAINEGGGERGFVAKLVDHSGNFPDEEAEIEFSEIPRDDWNLILPGALFSWNIGREERDGQIRRVSIFRFRRIFGFSPSQIKRAVENGKAMFEQLSTSDDGSALPPTRR